jgi:hypothetical protein
MKAKALESIAEEVLAIDDTELDTLLQHYKSRMTQGEPTRSWERAVVAYFLINAVRVKNALKKGKQQRPKVPSGQVPHLQLVRAQ